MAASGWQPVAHAAELRAGEDIVLAFAAGRELALWRSAGGSLQAWDNRCPHRSVRLTLGQVIGERLSCAYHGWQYEAGSGRCAAIPAHPGLTPPPLCVPSHPVRQACGLVWVGIGAHTGEPPADAVPDGWSYCRCLPVRAGWDRVDSVLQSAGWTQAGSARRGMLGGAAACAIAGNARDDLSFIFLWVDAPAASAPMADAHRDAIRLRRRIEARTPADRPA